MMEYEASVVKFSLLWLFLSCGNAGVETRVTTITVNTVVMAGITFTCGSDDGSLYCDEATAFLQALWCREVTGC